MPYQIKWKDGSVSDVSDADLENLPKEMESDIGSISQASAPSTPLDSAISAVRNAPATDYYMGRAYTPQPVQATPSIVEGIKKAYNYAAGEEQEDPNTLGKIWKGSAHTIVDRPADLALGLAAPFLPLSMGGVALASGAGAMTNAVNKMHLSGDAPSEYQTKSYGENLADNLVTGGVSGLAHGLGTLGSKFTGAIKTGILSKAEENAADAARVAADKEYANKLVKGVGSEMKMAREDAQIAIDVIEEIKKKNPNISFDELREQLKQNTNIQLLKKKYAEYLSNNAPIKISPDKVSEVDALKWYNSVMETTPTHKPILPENIDASLAGAIIGHSVLGVPGAIAGIAAPKLWSMSRPTLEKAAVDMARSPALNASLQAAAKTASPASLFALNTTKAQLERKK